MEIDKFALYKLNELIKATTESFDTYEFHIAYHEINKFCVNDMSNFYLDIIKDRLYTSKPDSIERRAAQTTMYTILSALVKMLTPMTAFTAEEIWKFMPHKKSESAESPMLSYWPELVPEYDNKEIAKRWEKLEDLKELVAKKLEIARNDKLIGHSLNAKVTLYAEGDNLAFLKSVEKELQDVFIVSSVSIEENSRTDEGEKYGVKVEVAPGEKCERCWRFDETVGEDNEHPTLCHRCVTVIK